jgi:hypothetical protein
MPPNRLVFFYKILKYHLPTSIADITNDTLCPDVDLDLHRPIKTSGCSRIRVRCSTSEYTEGYAIAIAEASKATKGIGNGIVAAMGLRVDGTITVSPQQCIYRYLGGVLQKLDMFVRIVDEAVKVQSEHDWFFVYSYSIIDSSICQVRLANCIFRL